MVCVRFVRICVIQSILFSIALCDLAQRCTPSNCKLENGCVCSSPSSPIPIEETPQFVTLTFDDSVTSINSLLHYSRLFNRTNADGSPIGTTFYVPHSYTDYEQVNILYNKGYEIGVNSISKGTVDYFRNATTQQLEDEFGGQRTIISIFANIPIDEINGVRTPHFQISDNRTFEAYKRAGLSYDNSWVALTNQPLFPYTLDYQSKQQCNVGTCPNESFPGLWVLPVTNHVGEDKDCNVLFSCGINSTSPSDITNWLIQQFQSSYKDTKQPVNFLLNAAWFELDPNSVEGFEGFLDYLQTLTDTFVISHAELLRWSKNPISLNEYKPTLVQQNADCNPRTCPLEFLDNEIRYMRTCVACPDVYPWLGNPTGKVQ